MHKRVPVVDIEINTDLGMIVNINDVHNVEHIPIGIAVKKGQPDLRDLNKWWVGRSIPASRSGIREALQVLDMYSTSILLEKCFGLGLSDQYWINDPRKSLEWDKINFFDNPFSEDVGNILFGKIPEKAIDLCSPDNTSDGWLKKRWIIVDGKRVLLKGGSDPVNQEPLNEVLASAIMRRLDIPHVEYTVMGINGLPMSMCEDFVTTETELISAWNILLTNPAKPNSISLCQHFLNCCEALGIRNMREMIDRMLVVDFLIGNTDRHFNNFGAVRNADTLEWIGAAPIFDCGTSMWHNKLTNKIDPYFKIQSKPFKSNHSEQIKLVSNFDWINFAALENIDDEVLDIYKISEYIDEERQRTLLFSLKKRIEMLKSKAD
ncbi:MAG: HipA domain-containing protein [Chitinispirillia bacterium]|nr:HipA domain-containing protein [Chitinispirillia bacterium]